jgi:hypothetical protein
MDAGDINYAARSIADALYAEIRAKRILLAYVDGNSIRCTVAGFLAAGSHHPSPKQIEDLETLVWLFFNTRA